MTPIRRPGAGPRRSSSSEDAVASTHLRLVIFARDRVAAELSGQRGRRAEKRDAGRSPTSACASNRATIICWAMGLTQHENGGRQRCRSVVNLLLMGVATSAAPALAPARYADTANVQGDRTVGIMEKPAGGLSSTRSARHFGFDAATQSTDSTRVVHAIEAMHRRATLRCSVAMGGNFLSAATPDTRCDRRRPCERCRLTACMCRPSSTARTRSSPAAIKRSSCRVRARTERRPRQVPGGEQFVHGRELDERFVHASRRASFEPASDALRSEPCRSLRVIALGRRAHSTSSGRLGFPRYLPTISMIRADIAAVSSPGFERYEPAARSSPAGSTCGNGPREGRSSTPPTA